MNEIRPQFYTIPKKLTLNGLRPDIVKLLDRNTGENFCNTGPGNYILDRTPKKKKKEKKRSNTRKTHRTTKTKRLLHSKGRNSSKKDNLLNGRKYL